jgi:hypothetical protein
MQMPWPEQRTAAVSSTSSCSRALPLFIRSKGIVARYFG